MGSRRIHILVTCAKRKRLPVPRELQLHRVKGKTIQERAAEWGRQLRRYQGERVPARHLYAGGHWSIASGLTAAASAFDPHLWVISTGYGLIPADAPIAPYSATFSSDHEDPVRIGNAPEAQQFTEWWDRVCRLPGPLEGEPRTIAALAERDPGAVIVVVASEPYLAAVNLDIRRAMERLRSPGQVVVISAGTKDCGLGDGACIVPIDARAQAALGGTRQTLNVRMAQRVLRELKPGFDSEVVAARWKCWLDEQRMPDVPLRERSTDEEVRAFIKRELRRWPDATATRLLRRYRDSGRACEQSRFGALVKAVRKETHA